ncbi:MAG: hypothetical protein ACI9DF_000978 [Verrucomicrobiales bacterium]|jgi:hypothetical protein
MSEAHRVYTVAKRNAWDLLGTAAPPAKGSSFRSMIPTRSPVSNDEVEAEKEHQRAITRRLEAMESQFEEWQEEMKTMVDNQLTTTVQP